jgi:hypothetical protein
LQNAITACQVAIPGIAYDKIIAADLGSGALANPQEFARITRQDQSIAAVGIDVFIVDRPDLDRL